ncbi:tryptophan synthase subunit alpha [Bacillus sp. FJAT-45037]|uniref:tryptophan synthase subunit alpha n=1 Tax=Bacillus sp. FJAT-45037 TaxID=2011007 RepID=UPI000C249046|nr:tryptophan synthase subunit alpha [Bacillus sp. FJAT-45037]
MSERMNQLTRKDGSLFIPFITAGDPSSDATIELALMLEEAGADLLELGIPYSDPLADGPTIQEASKRALKGGMTLGGAMKLVPVMRERGLTIPVVVFTYFNPLLQFGEERFTQLASEMGIDGLLVPDLPYEENVHLVALCEKEKLSFISLVAPTSNERIEKIARRAQGFLYCVSSLGVTGERKKIDARVYDFLQTVREKSSVPIAVGFGISSAEQVKEMNQHADGVIVGSALVAEIAKYEEQLKDEKNRKDALFQIKTFVTSLISS